MSKQIAIAIYTPFLTVPEFSKQTGMPINTVKKKISNGQIPIKKKASRAGKASRETPLINMVALTLEGLADYNNKVSFVDDIAK